MKADIYKKSKKDFELHPNLTDYDKTYKKFVYKDYKIELEWFPGNKLNAAYNAVDRHLKTDKKNKIALYWEDDSGYTSKYTYQELARLSNKFGNLLKSLGVERGDRVFLFLPRIPEVYFAFLGILKIGAICGTLFSAFQETALEDRLGNSDAKIVITTSDLKPRIDKIRKTLPSLEQVLTVDTNKFKKSFSQASNKLNVSHMKPEDYAFMLYTSGTTGKPKGVMHTHQSILHEHLTAKWALDLHDEDTYWCTADHGWVTGIAYNILGTLSNGVTHVLYNGRFSPQKWYEILEKYRVNVWYTAPTAIRMLMGHGTKLIKKYDLSALRHMCSVGEPLNPEAVKWGIKAFGRPFHDTWWQTETGGMCIVNLPSLDIKIGSMGKPFPGITAAIVDDKGNVLGANREGNIALKPGWPSMMKTIWRRPNKYESYFMNGWYIAGDRGLVDKDGYFWFIGRADDVIKTSGERVGPFEVESALVEHPAIVEAGVIGKPDPVRSEIIKAFVVVDDDYAGRIKDKKGQEKLAEELKQYVKKHLAGHAYPREVAFKDKLPKTRSGKIMRRILKAEELGLPIGDTSTLEEY